VCQARHQRGPVAPGAPLQQVGAASAEPLLRIESIAYGANGRPLEHYRALHRCKSSRLHVQTTA